MFQPQSSVTKETEIATYTHDQNSESLMVSLQYKQYVPEGNPLTSRVIQNDSGFLKDYC